MGALCAKSPRRRLAGHEYDIDVKRRRALARAGIEIAADAGDLAAKAPVMIASLPKASALAATVAAIVAARVPRRVVIEASTFELRIRRRPKPACARPAMFCSIVRSAAPASRPRPRPCDLCSGGAAEIKKLRSLFADFTRAVTISAPSATAAA